MVSTRLLLTGGGHDLVELGHKLQQLGYEVQVQARIEEAIKTWAVGDCDTALLSISASQRDPYSAITAFRQQRSQSTIVVLGGAAQEIERAAAIAAGADDYVTQACDATGLHERLNALHRYRPAAAPTQVRLGSLVLTAGEPTIRVGTARLELSPSERGLLELFALAPEHVVGKQAIAHRFAKDGRPLSTTAIHLLLHRLRRRLLPLGFCIVIRRGLGYQLQFPGDDTHSQQLRPGKASSRNGNGHRDDELLPAIPLSETDPLSEPALEPVPEGWDTRLLEYTNDAIMIWEMQGRGILFWNSAAERLYGYSRSSAVGKTTHQLLKTQLAGGVSHLERNLARYGVWIGELTHTTVAGQRVQVEARLALMSQSNGRWLVLEVNRDVTNFKSLELSNRLMDQLLLDLHALGEAQ